ncbi:MAG: glycosyl hydrolase [Chlorobi bacterium]|nr:glycosyl hydrolase [Chlorobiota bacterium]
MKVILSRTVLMFFALILIVPASGQENDSLLSGKTFSGLKFRSIGPAFMSGRIADIAIDPVDENIWYVAAGSGGVWKTENSGTTWKPVFNHQKVYSIGCLTIDPTNHHVIWVGTGENVGGRHVGYGDGIYKSSDDGEHWVNMGLKETQHISKIIVHPENPDIVWVAAQGPLWNKGGQRGVYKTVDGGKTWKKVLGDEEWTGATDIAIDPRNPKRLYAATWQRHRNVAAYMGGGPGSGIYRSEDGGETWIRLKKGLPTGNMGKIGLAVSAQNPDVVYAAIELDIRTGGVFKSTNRGASWTKQSSAVSGATGPHYYQELYADPHRFDRIYLCDVRIQVSDDGGKTFRRLQEQKKHSDNHAIAFKAKAKDYLLVGTDGGLYETYDLAKNWRFIANLPLTQFYKVAVDDAYPFYHIIGGTQDNSTERGPSRTDKWQGITNEDWEVILGADGHQPATIPEKPNLVYAEWQEGHLNRIDLTTGEIVSIQPQPGPGEGHERYNWDAPVLVSTHSESRVYYASQRVWRSDDYGDSWTPISGDLTRNEERLTLPIMGKKWGYNAPWDVYAMSEFNTITSLAESPLEEGLIYAGTDDGLIQVTEDGGENWRKINVGDLPGVPGTAFVNDIKADLFDANIVYVVLDNHKYGDLTPYLLKSTNRGKSWKSIRSNLPDKTLVWRIVQDHKDANLMFIGTEFGIYFTIDGGGRWIKLTGGLPTISFRDLAIQRRENDLIGASFGRSFYVLDDYSLLRHISTDQLKEEATLFPLRDAMWYIQRMGKGSQGAAFFTAPNPPFGAQFTYYLKDGYKTKKSVREEKEKKLNKQFKDVEFPSWDELESERMENKPVVWLTVKDTEGHVIRRIKGPVSKGFHRISWDLTYPSDRAIDIHSKPFKRENYWRQNGAMVVPGTYTVSLSKEIDGVVTNLSEPVTFKVVPIRQGVLKGAPPEETVAFWKKIQKLWGDVSATSLSLKNAIKEINGMQSALTLSEAEPGNLDKQVDKLRLELLKLDARLNGNKSKDQIGAKYPPTVKNRLQAAYTVVNNSTYGPTETAKMSLKIAQDDYKTIKSELDNIVDNKLPALKKELLDAGAPVVE